MSIIIIGLNLSNSISIFSKYPCVMYLSGLFLLNNLFHFKYRPGGIPARSARGERLLLFVGIIDILQSYRLKKKLEHTWKSMIHDGVSNILIFSSNNSKYFVNRRAWRFIKFIPLLSLSFYKFIKHTGSVSNKKKLTEQKF